MVPPVDYDINDTDDDCLQSTAHVDNTTSVNIGKGGFVDLDKIAPKQRDLRSVDDEKRMELVTHNGQTYFAPVKDKLKIDNVHKWERAFRVYATIYSKYNPHRAFEICQYIQTIQMAAASFAWDNVAYYDYYFRQRMAKKPQRCWGKVFTELWTLSMHDPVNRNTNNFMQQQHNSSNNSGRFGDWRDNCCWRYNKNKCKKPANECKYEHKCSYCGSFSHIFLNCHKRRRSGQSGDKSNKHDGRDTGSTSTKK